ncbi:hypothetical protein ACSDR0_28940 [Streptosporangium sp. G11]|uniref:hypothetical protein n=1 Tax=Streptosporangium sp. G11 TaxID=3436926 RepID=UPI003EBCBFA1
MNIVVFDAGGGAGGRVVAEARRRGHRVTAVVRDPAGHSDPADARMVAGDFDHAGTRTGRYRIADHADPAGRITYADFAMALLDEIGAPRRHRAAVSIREA